MHSNHMAVQKQHEQGQNRINVHVFINLKKGKSGKEDRVLSVLFPEN